MFFYGTMPPILLTSARKTLGVLQEDKFEGKKRLNRQGDNAPNLPSGHNCSTVKDTDIKK